FSRNFLRHVDLPPPAAEGGWPALQEGADPLPEGGAAPYRPELALLGGELRVQALGGGLVHEAAGSTERGGRHRSGDMLGQGRSGRQGVAIVDHLLDEPRLEQRLGPQSLVLK